MGKQYNCGPCHQFDPEHALVARQWWKQAEREQHFFAVLDFANGQDIFQRFRLTSAPNFQLYKPTEGPRASLKTEPESFDLGRTGFRAEPLAQYIHGTADIPIRFSRPIDRSRMITMALAILAFVVSCIFSWNYIKFIVRQPVIWALAIITLILLMTSGYMWVQIRKPNYIQVGQQGQVNYIAGGYQNQLGAEVHIISVIYGVLGLSVFTMAHTIPKVQDPVRQRLAIYVWTSIIVVLAGILMNIFAVKQGGYPFRIF